MGAGRADTTTHDTETTSVADGPGPGMRAGGAVLTGLLVLAAALRLYRLGDDSLWDNEILSLRRATAGLRDAYDLIREGTHPPGYSQIVLRPWLAIGDGEWMQRIPSVVFGVGTVALTAGVGTRLAGRRAGVIAAALLTVMPLHLYYSREGRMYALLALVLLAWVAALIRAHERDTPQDWAVYTVLGAAALYSHYYAGFTVVSVVAITAIVEWRSGMTERTRRWAIATAAIGVAFLPWLPTFWYQVGNDPVAHLPALTLRGVAELPILFFTAFAGRSALDTIAVGVALAVLLGAGLRELRVEGTNSPSVGFGAAIVIGAVLGTFALSVFVSAVRPLIFVRYFVGILPLLALILGAGLARVRAVTAAACAVLMIVSVAHAVPTVRDTWRPAFGAATDRIEADGADATIVVMVGADPTDFRAAGFDHYLDPGIAVIDVVGRVSDPVFGDALDQLDEDITRVWVLQYDTVTSFEPPTGFTTTASERYDSRFFDGTYRISLDRLERSAP